MNEHHKTLLTVILLGTSLLCSLLFQIKLTGPAGTHFILLSIASVLFAAVLAGLWLEETWAQPLATVLFALGLADLAWMYTRTHDVLFSVIALLVNAAGMATVTMGGMRGFHSLETYDLEEDIRDLKKELESMRNARKKAKRK